MKIFNPMRAIPFSNFMKIFTKIVYQYEEMLMFCFCKDKVDCLLCKNRRFLEQGEMRCSLCEMKRLFIQTNGLKILAENYENYQTLEGIANKVFDFLSCCYDENMWSLDLFD